MRCVRGCQKSATYSVVAESWLRNLEAGRERIIELFGAVYGPEQAEAWWIRWRVYFRICAVMWG